MTEVSPASASPAQPARVLVVDDEPQIRRFLEISLRAQGYQVEVAETGQAGLAALSAAALVGVRVRTWV